MGMFSLLQQVQALNLQSTDGMVQVKMVRYRVFKKYLFCMHVHVRTPVRVSKTNAVARAQSAFQMLSLLQKYLHRQSQY